MSEAESSVLFLTITVIYASLGFFIVFIWAYRQRKRLASRQRAPQRCLPFAWGDLTDRERTLVVKALCNTANTRILPPVKDSSRHLGWRLIETEDGRIEEQHYRTEILNALFKLANSARQFDPALEKPPGQSWKEYLEFLCHHAPPLNGLNQVARAISDQYDRMTLSSDEVELDEFEVMMRSIRTLSRRL